MASVLALVAIPILVQNSKADPSDGNTAAVNGLGHPFPQACCPSDDNRAAANGLGQAFPQTTDISLASAWRVYGFEREGIRYLQVNGLDGAVRMAVGYIDGTFWVLPVGTDAVSTPQRPLAIPAGAVRSVVYRSLQFELAVYNAGRRTLFWSVETSAR